MSQLTDQILALQATSRTEFDLRMEREIHRLRFDFFLCRTVLLSIPYFLPSRNLNFILTLNLYVHVYLSLPISLSLSFFLLYIILSFSLPLSLCLSLSLSLYLSIPLFLSYLFLSSPSSFFHFISVNHIGMILKGKWRP